MRDTERSIGKKAAGMTPERLDAASNVAIMQDLCIIKKIRALQYEAKKGKERIIHGIKESPDTG